MFGSGASRFRNGGDPLLHHLRVAACDDARASAAGPQPTAILATTVKGRGLAFTEGRFEWHARVATADDVAAARLELGLEPAAELRS